MSSFIAKAGYMASVFDGVPENPDPSGDGGVHAVTLLGSVM